MPQSEYAHGTCIHFSQVRQGARDGCLPGSLKAFLETSAISKCNSCGVGADIVDKRNCGWTKQLTAGTRARPHEPCLKGGSPAAALTAGPPVLVDAMRMNPHTQRAGRCSNLDGESDVAEWILRTFLAHFETVKARSAGSRL